MWNSTTIQKSWMDWLSSNIVYTTNYNYEDIFEKRYLEGQFEELKCK